MVLKLFMILLGCRPNGRNVEQHDFFFGIAPSLKELIPEMKRFWPEAKGKIHIDAWQEVNFVDSFQISILNRNEKNDTVIKSNKLFFINLGGYLENRFEEQHYTLLTVKKNKAEALKQAKNTFFFKNNNFNCAVAHIDDKYAIDVDDLHEIQDILIPSQKEKYSIQLNLVNEYKADEMHLGYLKLSQL